MTDTTAPAAGGQGGAAALLTGSAPTTTDTANDWTAGLDDAAKGYVQNKGWKSPVDLFTSYQNLEKLRGVPAELLLQLPADDNPEAWGKVWAKLGRPETPDGYKLPVAEGGNPETVKQLASWMHEAGIPAKQAQAFVAKMQEGGTALQKAQEQKLAQQSEADVAELKGTWGAAFDKQTEMGRRFARELGLDTNALSAIESAIGTKKLLEIMAAGGAKLGEHAPAGFEGGGKGFGVMTPEAAQERIKALHSDKEWVDKYMGGGAEQNAEMQRLIKYANGMA